MLTAAGVVVLDGRLGPCTLRAPFVFADLCGHGGHGQETNEPKTVAGMTPVKRMETMQPMAMQQIDLSLPASRVYANL